MAERGAGSWGALTDSFSLFKTRCTWAGVGTVRDYGRQVPTGTFTVVTWRSRGLDGAWEHTVVSAYPDWDNW